MSGYVRSAQFSTEFEGDPVTCQLAPLSIADLLKMQSADAGSTKQEQERLTAQILAEIAPKYVSEWSGPKDSDGNMVTVEEVCQSAYFVRLAMELGAELVERAHPPTKPSEHSAS